jgi:HD-GYP domain-containing protein (c-di-GMP phosphodiesterase class II)
MNLAPINVNSIRLNNPLPYHLVDKAGVLLAKKGFVIETEKYLVEIARRGGGIFIDLENPENQSPKDVQRAFVDELQTMVRRERSIGEIANVRAPTESGSTKKVVVVSDRVDWLDLQVQANSLLRNPSPDTFHERFEQVAANLNHQITRNPDGALFSLFYLSAAETQMYSATHSMIVSAMCVIAAREVLNWPAETVTTLFNAALTMNLGMTALQDRLALQKSPPDNFQRAEIDAHAEKSTEILKSLSIEDTVWLDAVRNHHAQIPGPLATRSPADRIARLIQRADTFAARLSPRVSRTPTTAAVAMKGCYFDEVSSVDEAGAALIKAVGIYQPGSYVKLVTGEIGVVVRRGSNASSPKVAVVVNKSGIPVAEPSIRDTSAKAFAVASSIPQREVKLNLNMERMLQMTQSGVS